MMVAQISGKYPKIMPDARCKPVVRTYFGVKVRKEVNRD